jgi:hypothetical protein
MCAVCAVFAVWILPHSCFWASARIKDSAVGRDSDTCVLARLCSGEIWGIGPPPWDPPRGFPREPPGELPRGHPGGHSAETPEDTTGASIGSERASVVGAIRGVIYKLIYVLGGGRRPPLNHVIYDPPDCPHNRPPFSPLYWRL